MTRKQLESLCLSLAGAVEDHPFRDDNWMVARHGLGGRIFAMVYQRDSKLYINLKCEPMRADFLRNLFQGVTPGYHMNKIHWNTVLIGSDVPLGELQNMIHHSHQLTRPKRGKPRA